MVGSLVAVCGGFQVSFLFSGGNEFFDGLVGRIGLNSNNTGFSQMVGDRNDVIDGEGCPDCAAKVVNVGRLMKPMVWPSGLD